MRRCIAVAVAYILVLCLRTVAYPSAGDLTEHHGAMVPVSGPPGACIVCHDGIKAPAVGFCIENCTFSGAHAISKTYPPPGREQNFRSVSELEECGIALMDGKIVCTSCHNLRIAEGAHLAVTTCGSRLCLSCHLK